MNFRLNTIRLHLSSPDCTLRPGAASLIAACILIAGPVAADGPSTVIVGSTVLTASGQNNQPMTVPSTSTAATTAIPQIITAPDVPEVVTAPDLPTPQPANSPRPASMPRAATPALPIVLERPLNPVRPVVTPTPIPKSARVRDPQPVPRRNLLGGQGVPNSPEARIAYALNLARQGQHESAMALCNQLLADTSLNRAQLDRARLCVDFDVPLVRLRALITARQMASARNLLNVMLRATRADSEQRRYLLSVRQATAKAKPVDAPANPADAVLAEVTRILEKWRQENGHFPRSYGELNKALPADTPPLVEYDIINYAGNKNEFSVAIRNREKPKEVLSLHKTGLLR